LRILVYRLLEALIVLHKYHWIHGDLSTHNIIVLDEPLTLTLIDFGYTDRFRFPEKIKYQGTLPYIAPEIIREEESWGFPSDMWSLGVIIAESLTGKKPIFSRENKENSLSEALEFLHDSSKYKEMAEKNRDMWNPLAWDFISKLIILEPEKRLTSQQAIDHPFFEGIKPRIEPVAPRKIPVAYKIIPAAPRNIPVAYK